MILLRVNKIIVLFVFLSTFVCGQNTIKKPTLLETVTNGYDDIHEQLSGPMLFLEHYLKNYDNSLAIRVCSSKPLPMALSIAIGSPLDFVSQLVEFYVPVEKVTYLRSTSHCSASQLDKHVEYWILPKNSELPKFEDLRLASNLEHKHFIAIDRLVELDEYGNNSYLSKVNESNYKTQLDKLLKFVENKRNAFIIADVCSKKDRNSKKRKVHLATLSTYLDKAKISKERLFTSKYKSGYCFEFPGLSIIYEK